MRQQYLAWRKAHVMGVDPTWESWQAAYKSALFDAARTAKGLAARMEPVQADVAAGLAEAFIQLAADEPEGPQIIL